MFGYVRPLKPELLVREYSRYRSVYCGLCTQIGRDYGQLPRFAVNYDLTLLSLLLLSLTEDQPKEEMRGCVLNPLTRKAMAIGGAVLQHCAALSVLLAFYAADDQVRDQEAQSARFIRLAFSVAKKRAAKTFPVYDQVIRQGLSELSQAEQQTPDPAAANIFGAMLQQLFKETACQTGLEKGPVLDALGLLGYDLGRWIFLVDAIDDWEDDCDHNRWNPFGLQRSLPEARARASTLLSELEMALDRTAALLPYVQDSGLMENIFTLGLPAVSQKVLSGMPLGKL